MRRFLLAVTCLLVTGVPALAAAPEAVLASVKRAVAADPDMADVFAAFRQRVTTAVDRLADATRADVAAVFCHGGVIEACIEKALSGVRLPTAEPEYGSITRITISARGEWRLRSLNEIHHLERFSAQRGERNELSR